MKLLRSRAICITLSDSWISLVGTRSPVGNHVVGFICGNKKSGTSLVSPQTNNMVEERLSKVGDPLKVFSAQL